MRLAALLFLPLSFQVTDYFANEWLKKENKTKVFFWAQTWKMGVSKTHPHCSDNQEISPETQNKAESHPSIIIHSVKTSPDPLLKSKKLE